MFCSTAPFSLVMQRTYNTHRWMKFDLHGHNRATTPNNVTIEPGVVGTAIEGTIRLQSDFEVRHGYSSMFLYSSFWYLLQLARDPRTACTWQSFARESSFFSCIDDIIWTDGFPIDHKKMIDAFSAAFFKMGLIGRRQQEQAFLYSCDATRPWTRKCCENLHSCPARTWQIPNGSITSISQRAGKFKFEGLSTNQVDA